MKSSNHVTLLYPKLLPLIAQLKYGCSVQKLKNGSTIDYFVESYKERSTWTYVGNIVN
jgi:hypothetical protein